MNFTIDDVNILYEDNHVIVAVKPQNMPSVPDESGDADMYTVLKEYIKQKENKPGDAFLGVVHRLDRPTGGVMMFAKTSKAAERLTSAVKEREVEKKYLAVINGKLKSDRGTLVNWLRKNPSTNVVSVVTSLTEGAKEARLDYEQLETLGAISLVRVVLRTGRGHQIRVQMAAQNCPLFGDVKYGDKLARGSNLALWACELRFTHPVTGDAMIFVCYPPEEKEPWKKFQLKKYLENFYN